jgi:hypothetical protein
MLMCPLIFASLDCAVFCWDFEDVVVVEDVGAMVQRWDVEKLGRRACSVTLTIDCVVLACLLAAACCCR